MRPVALALFLIACGDDGSSPIDAAPGVPALVTTQPDGMPTTSVVVAQTTVGQGTSATVVVTNTGTATTGPLAISIGGAHANDFAIDNQGTTCAALALAPAASCEVTLMFRPLAAGARAADLTIASNPGGTTSIALMGTAVMPDLHFNPTSITLGPLEVGSTGQSSIELRNDGTAAAPIGAITFAGAGYTQGISTCGSSLAAGSSCDIVINVVVQQLGSQTGSLTVTSGGIGFSAPLTTRGARRVTVQTAGNGTGTITSTPAGITCGTTCTGLFEGDVLLTATPGVNAQLTSWSIASCGQATTCNVLAELTPITVQATFALVGSSSFQVVFAGDGAGEVDVRGPGGLIAICVASCTLPVMPGDFIRVNVSTPSTFGGLSGDCTSSGGGSAECVFNAPVGTSTMTATFTKDPKEQWTRLIPGPKFHTTAIDSANNLIVATHSRVTKLSPTGSTLWALDLTGVRELATGPGDTIYVVHGAGTTLVKLGPTSAELWSRTLVAASCQGANAADTNADPDGAFGNCMAVGPTGEVAVTSGSSVERWDSAGAFSWSRAIAPMSGTVRAIAIIAGGTIVAGQYRSFGEGLGAVQFDVAGNALADLGTLGQYHGMFAASASGQLLTTTSGHSDVTGPCGPAFGDDNWVPTGIAAASTGDVGFVNWHNDNNSTANPWTLRRCASNGITAWSVTRPRLVTGLAPGSFGGLPHHIAAGPTGRIALVGSYEGITYSGGWVQVYDP